MSGERLSQDGSTNPNQVASDIAAVLKSAFEEVGGYDTSGIPENPDPRHPIVIEVPNSNE